MERLEQRTWAEVGALVHHEQLRVCDPTLPPFAPARLAAALDRHPRWRLLVEALLITPRKGRRKRPRFCAAAAQFRIGRMPCAGKQYLKH
jgi:hypothetical protein